jgi:hypothetical protein
MRVPYAALAAAMAAAAAVAAAAIGGEGSSKSRLAYFAKWHQTRKRLSEGGD